MRRVIIHPKGNPDQNQRHEKIITKGARRYRASLASPTHAIP
jgi:hypothetical protein